MSARFITMNMGTYHEVRLEVGPVGGPNHPVHSDVSRLKADAVRDFLNTAPFEILDFYVRRVERGTR